MAKQKVIDRKPLVDRKPLMEALLEKRGLAGQALLGGEISNALVQLPHLGENTHMVLGINMDTFSMICVLDDPAFQKKTKLKKLEFVNELNIRFLQTKFHLRGENLIATYYVRLPERGESVLLELMDLALMDFLEDIEDYFGEMVEAELRKRRYQRQKCGNEDEKAEEGGTGL